MPLPKPDAPIPTSPGSWSIDDTTLLCTAREMWGSGASASAAMAATASSYRHMNPPALTLIPRQHLLTRLRSTPIESAASRMEGYVLRIFPRESGCMEILTTLRLAEVAGLE